MYLSSIVVPSLFTAAVAAYAAPDASFYRRDLYVREAYPQFEEGDLYAREVYLDFKERDMEERDLYAREIYPDLIPRADYIFAGGSGKDDKTTTTITSDGRKKSDFHGPKITTVQTWSVTSHKKPSDAATSNRKTQIIDGKWHKRNAENMKRELFARAAAVYFEERDACPEAYFEERDASADDYFDNRDPFSEAYFEERDAYPELEDDE